MAQLAPVTRESAAQIRRKAAEAVAALSPAQRLKLKDVLQRRLVYDRERDRWV